jgi:hypothetical protein
MSKLSDYRDVIRLYRGEWFTLEDLKEATHHLRGDHCHPTRCINAITTFKPRLERRYSSPSRRLPQQYRERDA